MRVKRLDFVTLSSPLESPFIRILEAAVNEDAWSCPGLEETQRLREAARHTIDAFLVAWQVAETDEQRSALLRTTQPAFVREAIARPGGREFLLGRYDDSDIWHPGLAGLTEQEARAWEMHAEGFGYREIATFMDGKQRRTKQFGVSVEAVHRHLMRGGLKLRALFGQGEIAA